MWAELGSTWSNPGSNPACDDGQLLQLRLGPLKHGDLLELDLHEAPWDGDKDGACKGGSPHDDIKVGVGKTVVIGGGMRGLGEGGAQEQ